MNNQLKEYMLQQQERLMAIHSPTGYCNDADAYIVDELKALGFEPTVLKKGGVICDIGGEGNAILFGAHLDTIGGMVRTIKADGRLQITTLGGLSPIHSVTENVVVITRCGKRYEGTIQMVNPSVHVNDNVNTAPSFDTNVEVVLDEFVKSAADVRELGICNGDIVSLEPCYRITSKGYIKSRFLDDKAAAAILLAVAKAVKDGELTLGRKVYLDFTTYEEVGHGGSAGIPSDVVDVVSVDMGCVGAGLDGDETKVSICAKDTAGPYSYDLTTELINCAKAAGLDYVVDIYPRYGSDAETTIRAGYDVRHGLIGPGVYASHGYERSHINGLVNTYELIYNFVK